MASAGLQQLPRKTASTKPRVGFAPSASSEELHLEQTNKQGLVSIGQSCSGPSSSKKRKGSFPAEERGEEASQGDGKETLQGTGSGGDQGRAGKEVAPLGTP